MSDLESAEAFARSIIQAVEDDHLLSREALPLWIAAEIKGRDAAVRLALLDEFRERLQRYYEHARGPAEMILGELLAKYTKKEAGNG